MERRRGNLPTSEIAAHLAGHRTANGSRSMRCERVCPAIFVVAAGGGPATAIVADRIPEHGSQLVERRQVDLLCLGSRQRRISGLESASQHRAGAAGDAARWVLPLLNRSTVVCFTTQKLALITPRSGKSLRREAESGDYPRFCAPKRGPTGRLQTMGFYFSVMRMAQGPL